MDEFFDLFDSSDIMSSSWSWVEETETPQLMRQTAFQRYRSLPLIQRHASSISNPNANKRMMEFLKKNRAAAAPPLTAQQERERSLKHIMAERLRRKKHRQIYLALHQLLPLGTKSDEKSILETAVKEIGELRRRDEELRKQNGEMEMIMNEMMMFAEIEKARLDLKVGYPASGVDSMLEVLRCLKMAGCSATSLHSTFMHHHFAATLHFQTTMMRAAQVEKAVQRSLFDVEMKFRPHQ